MTNYQFGCESLEPQANYLANHNVIVTSRGGGPVFLSNIYSSKRNPFTHFAEYSILLQDPPPAPEILPPAFLPLTRIACRILNSGHIISQR